MSDPVTIEPNDEYNQALVANVHPADWVNPTPQGRYNLAVIGAGTAGLITAIGAAGLGAKVALIERHLLGGDCLNHGCVPSKGVIGAARAAHAVRTAGDFGIRVPGGWDVDFGAAMARMRRIRSEISHHDSARRFRDLGVDVYLGAAAFVDDTHIAVDGTTLEFTKAVIATGARAFVPPIPGLEDTGYLTNETVFSLTERPARLAVIGGGPIGCELAQAFQRLGSQVTLIDLAPEILPREDAVAARIVRASMARDGVVFVTGAKVQRVEKSGTATRIHLGQDGVVTSVETDALLVAVGRAPNVDGLNLDAVNVAHSPQAGVEVDDTLRTANPRIYACGDVCQVHKFTHVADAAARIAIRNTLFPFLPKSRYSKLVIPWVTYTDPEIAHVGLSERDAAERNIAIDTVTVSLAENDRARLDGHTAGLLKVHVATGSDRILGATLVSPHAGETVSELTLAITRKIGLGKFSAVIHPYPTEAEVLKRAGDAVMRRRFKPWLAALFARVMSWQR